MMKWKFCLIFGLMFFIGLVGASEQEYNINVNVHSDGNNSESIILNVDSPTEGEIVGKDIDFNVGINYANLSEVSCMIEFNNDRNGIIFLDSGESFLKLFDIGIVNWNINCWTNSINASKNSSFIIEANSLEITGISGVYSNDDDINTGSVSFFAPGTKLQLRHENSPWKNISISSKDFTIDEDDISSVGKYTLKASRNLLYDGTLVSDSVDFYVVDVDFSLDDYSIDLGDSVEIELIIDNPNKFDGEYTIEVNGNHNILSNSYKVDINGNDVDKTFGYTPNSEGEYEIELIMKINHNGNWDYTKKLSLEVDSNEDTKNPEVNLVYPAWEEVIRSSEIEFIYDVTDNVDLAECTLKLYNATENSAGLYETAGLIFPLNNNDRDLAKEDPLGDDDTIKLKLIDFDEGQYIWEVKCKDGAGNSNVDYNYFVVDLSGGTYNYGGTISDGMDYAREEEVSDLVDAINSFLENINSLALDESQAAEILNIEDDMTHYKKKLLQIDQDLKYNLKFMSTDKYEKRIAEIDEEIDEIKDNIIVGIDVTDTYEYSKSSIDLEVKEIIFDYFDATGQNIGNSALKKIIKGNEELQDSISARVEVLAIDVEYIDGTKKMILVNKKFDIDSNPADKLLEVVPEDLAEQIFFTIDSDDIGEGIWEVRLSDLENDELTYYFFSEESLQNIQKTESLLFGEEIKGDVNLITGFVTGIGEIGSSMILPFLVLFLFMGYVGFVIFGKARLEVWKKEPNVVRILDLMKNTKLLLKENKVLDARENYQKMSEIYKVLPNKCKNFFFNEIKIIRLAIDKKDVLNLIIEYEKARNENRLTDASELHSKISSIYKKLPKKFQDKVYQRLIKNEVK